MSTSRLSRRRRVEQARIRSVRASGANSSVGRESQVTENRDTHHGQDGAHNVNVQSQTTFVQSRTIESSVFRVKECSENVSESEIQRNPAHSQVSANEVPPAITNSCADFPMNFCRAGEEFAFSETCDSMFVGGFEAEHDRARRGKSRKRKQRFVENDSESTRTLRDDSVMPFRPSGTLIPRNVRAVVSLPGGDVGEGSGNANGIGRLKPTDSMFQHGNNEPPSPSCSPPKSPIEDIGPQGTQRCAHLSVEEGPKHPEQQKGNPFCDERIGTFVEDFDPGNASSEDAENIDVEHSQAHRPLHTVRQFGGPLHVHESTQFPSPGSRKIHEGAGEKSGREMTGGESRTSYHVISFDCVLDHVLARYEGLLRPQNVHLAKFLRTSLSLDAKSLFVRIYYRKCCWHSNLSLQASYGDVDVPYAIAELIKTGLLITSEALQDDGDRCARLHCARSVLEDMVLEEMRSVCPVVACGKMLLRYSRSALHSAMINILDADSWGGAQTVKVDTIGAPQDGKRRMRQATIDGSNPADNLAFAILKKGYVRLPRYVRDHLERIHFLFFFEEGHDSPWVALAETGKLRFPKYECVSNLSVFPSRKVFEDFEEARSVDLTTQNCVENKAWGRALFYGSIGEVEVLGYVRRNQQLSGKTEQGQPSRRNRGAVGVWSQWLDLRAAPSCEAGAISRTNSARILAADERFLGCVETQLLHPFLRRFSPIWKYASAAWRSVKALEALKEYKSAVQRIGMLLESGLLASKRGQMMDRLTINLVHLGSDEQALVVICDALRGDESRLDRGTRYALARRGSAIHRRLRRPAELCKVAETVSTEKKRATVVNEAVLKSRPAEIVVAMRFDQKQIPVRIFRALARPTIAPADSSKHVFAGETAPVTECARVVGVKAQFFGINDDLAVSVEELALEWYECRSGWTGRHSEGGELRFLWCLLMWDAIYAPVPDVFQTPCQIAPWDLATEAFYSSRKAIIDGQVQNISTMSVAALASTIRSSYEDETRRGVSCIGQMWDACSVEDLVCIACGIGARALSRVCELLCKNFSYWSGGFPDLVLWKRDEGFAAPSSACQARSKLVEVKSQNDRLSDRQRAWLSELLDAGADCEVFQVVGQETRLNAGRLVDSDLDYVQLLQLGCGKFDLEGEI